MINRAYCIDNPKDFKGYGENAWGLTASDTYNGYAAHSPTEDNGTISPTAALSAFPYTPEYSMQALKHFYNTLGDKIWSEYGFVDAYNETQNWYASRHLAIDQGPIIVMIENYRSGLLWKLFMQAPEIARALSAGYGAATRLSPGGQRSVTLYAALPIRQGEISSSPPFLPPCACAPAGSKSTSTPRRNC